MRVDIEKSRDSQQEHDVGCDKTHGEDHGIDFVPLPFASSEDAIHQCSDLSTVEQDFSNGGSQRNGFPS